MSRSPEYWAHSFARGDSFRDRQRRGPAPAGRAPSVLLPPERIAQDPPRPDGPPQPVPAPGPPRCQRGEWCASAEHSLREDGTTAREPALVRQGVYCEADEAIIARCLADPGPDTADDLPALHGRLAAAILDGRLGQGGEVLVRLPFGPSVPMRLDADELMRWITASLLHWHERVADTRHLAGLDEVTGLGAAGVRRRELGMRAGELAAAAAPILAAQLGHLLALPPGEASRPSGPLLGAIHPDAEVTAQHGASALIVRLGGAAAGREILRLQYTARAVLGETEPPVVRLLGVPCRRCRRDDEPIGPLTLTAAPPPQHAGDPEYKSLCSRCGHLQTAAEFADWVKLNAAWLRGRVTPAQMAGLPADLRALAAPLGTAHAAA